MKCPICNGYFVVEAYREKGNVFMECKWCKKGDRDEFIDNILRPLPKDENIEIVQYYHEVVSLGRSYKEKIPSYQKRVIRILEENRDD